MYNKNALKMRKVKLWPCFSGGTGRESGAVDGMEQQEVSDPTRRQQIPGVRESAPQELLGRCDVDGSAGLSPVLSVSVRRFVISNCCIYNYNL